MAHELNFSAFSNSIPPQNVDAEESILGGILLDPEAIGRVADLLPPEALYITANREIYKAALKLHSQGQPTDLMSVTTWLYDNELLEKVGGQSKLAQLVDRTVSAINIDRYANLVMDKYLRRKLIQSGNEIVELGYQTSRELETVFDEAEQKVFGLTQASPKQSLVPIADTVGATYQEIQARSNNLSQPGIPSNFYDLDAFTGGFQRSDLIIIAGRPSMGKCLEKSSEIVLEDGSTATIEEICHRHQARLLTLDKDRKFSYTEPIAFVDDGVKPVFRLTTRLGRYVESTISHPYLTPGGWRLLWQLKPGEPIAVPRKIEVSSHETIHPSEVKLLAYLTGNSRLNSTSSQFNHSNPVIRADFAQAKTESKVGKEISSRSRLQELGLKDEKNQERTIPTIIFRLEQSLIALFVNRLFALNGEVKALRNGQAQLAYVTDNERLIRQLQHLLLRFGIIAALQQKSFKPRNKVQLTWQLSISDIQSLNIFVYEIGIFAQEEAISRLKTTLNKQQDSIDHQLNPWEISRKNAQNKGEHSQCGTLELSVNHYSNSYLSQSTVLQEKPYDLRLNSPLVQNHIIANSDVYWDEIVSIEPAGYKHVYDLTIPETHNFVANDICVHNTSFAMGVARNIAEHLPVAIFSLEMSKEQLVMRMLASEAGIESNYLRSGRISQNQWAPLSQANGTLSELPIFIDDTANQTVMQIRSKVRRLQAEQSGKLGLVLIDYLQLMENTGSENRVQELSRITRSLKGLGRELNVPIIALSQLSRGVEARTSKRPMMSDLRESGSIEQDADLVMMLYRDSYYNENSPDRDIAEVIIVKHRNGPVGTVKLLFKADTTKFLNLANKPTY